MLSLTRRSSATLVALSILAAGCTNHQPGEPRATERPPGVGIDSARLITDLSVLAADSMDGRGTGTAGAERARRYLSAAFEDAGLRTYGGTFLRPFTYSVSGASASGINLVGWIPGTASPTRAIVISAHYDHLGTRDGRIYNGADDNASGTAALLALARHLSAHPPRHTIIFLAVDAEEAGLRGARAFVDAPPIARDSIMLVINMDMVSRNAAGELYAAGTYHTPALEPVLRSVAASAPVTLRLGHDRPGLPAGDDWTQASDHGPFHSAGIPFVYFGVEDHEDYHKPTDDFEKVAPGFFVRAARTILSAATALDAAGVLAPRATR